jgi:hypothetical protein
MGVAIGGLMLATNMVAVAGPGDVLILFISAITTFLPLVFATAIGLLSLEVSE